MPSAITAQLKKRGTWKLLLSKFDFPSDCLSGTPSACPFCNAVAAFKFRAYDSACWGGCSACGVSGNGRVLLAAKTKLAEDSKELWRLVAAKLGFYSFTAPDYERTDSRPFERRKTTGR